MRISTRLKLAVCALAFVAACNSSLFVRRAVYVEDGSVVRLREDVKAKVWVQVDGKWEPSYMVLPEGWYCTFISADEKDSP